VLQLLVRFWLFPIFGMFFAAGAGVADLGSGGGDTGDGGGDGSSDGGDGSSDAGVDESGDDGDVELGESSDDTSADDRGENDQDPDAPVALTDGRQVPGKFKKLFDLAKKAGLEKEAKQLYFAQQRLNKAIPGGINAAIQLAKDVEQIGGMEAVQQLQDDIQVHQADAELFESNPAKWAEAGFQENPDSALKAFAHSLDFVSENHPEHYDHYMAKVIVNDLSNLDVRGIYQALSSLKDNAEAQKLARQLAEYYNSRSETAKKVPEKKADAQSKALTDREKSVKERELGVRFKEVNRDAHPALKTSVTKALQAQSKTAGVDLAKLSKEYPGEWRDLLNDIHQRVMRAAIKDSRFIDKYHALVEKNDLQRALKAINDKHEMLVPDAVRAAVAERGLFRKKKAGASDGDKGGDKGAAAAAQNQGWTKIAKRPENSMINWSKTTSAMQLDGKYILKDGKKVVVQY
jgi:hypothetical protein